METIKPINYLNSNLKRIAARLGFSFYITEHDVVVVKDVYKKATIPEIEMWREITRKTNLEVLPSTKEEMERSWANRTGPFTISPKDLYTLHSLGKTYFSKCAVTDLLKIGYFGIYIHNGRSCQVYVSKVVHPGFFYDGIVNSHLLPVIEQDKQVMKEIPESITLKLSNSMVPFSL